MPSLYVFDAATGQRLYGPSRRAAISDDLKARAAADHGGLAWVDPDDQYDHRVEAAIEAGEVASVQTAPVNEVWLHLSAAGGDGEDPPGAPTDGSVPLTISAALRATQDPASAVLTGVNRSYRITVRDAATGAVYDVRKITLASGEMAAVNYSGNGQAGECEVLESDFEQVEAGGTLYTVRLAQPVRFKFFGTLA
jgi:hypothetical protein